MNYQDIWPKAVPTAAKPPFRKKRGLYLDAKEVPRKCNRSLLVEISYFEVETTRGTAYPCRAKDLKSYRRRPLRTAKPPMDNEAATRLLVDWLSKPVVAGSVEHTAMHNLANGMQLEDWGPDLIIKAFDDLDVLFFRGVLATRTQLEWASPAQLRQSGKEPEEIFGMSSKLGYGRCHISLSPVANFLVSRDPYTQMWATVLHEMVHGYFQVQCDNTRPTSRDHYMGRDWAVGGHGEHFRRVITAVDRRFRKYFNMDTIGHWANWERDMRLVTEKCGRIE